MPAHPRSARRNRRGANVIEFALILPVLLALMTGIMDFGWAFAVRTAATTAARAGARAGALTPRDLLPEDAATTAAGDKWASLGLPMTPTVVAFRQGTAPEVMVVRIRIDLDSLFGLVLGPHTFDITEIRRMEDQP